MKEISLRKVVSAVLIVGVVTGYVWADKQELQAKLGKEMTFEFKDVTIAQALKNIGEESGVKIVLSDEAVWKLPFGEATRLSASLSGPLADSLTKMLSALFMRYAVGEEITIYPRRELEHIIGRPTTKQIRLLEMIYTYRLTFSGVKSSDEILPKILRDFDIVIVPIEYNAELEEFIERFVVESYLSPTFAQMLDSLGKWYISGVNLPGMVTEIRIVDEDEFREAKLDQVVDVSFEDRADVIIERLAGWAGMDLVVKKEDPSWLDEGIVIEMQNIKLRQAMRNIINSVNGVVTFYIPTNEIVITGPIQARKKEAASAKPKTGGSAGEGYVGKISIPMEDGKYFIEFMLRESDLTEELKKLREDKVKEIFEKVGKAGDQVPGIAANPQSYPIWN